MRNPKRIPILLDIYSRDSVKESYLKNIIGLAQKFDVNKFLQKWRLKESEGIIEEIWLENPNFRMSEILVTAKIIPVFRGEWLFTEDEKFLEQYGIADKRMTTIWNKKDGDLEEKGIPLKNISDKDLFFLKDELKDDFPNYLEKEIDYRKSNRITVVETGNPYYTLDID